MDNELPLLHEKHCSFFVTRLATCSQRLLEEKDAQNLKYKRALEKYADDKNWGNGGWEGHPDYLWRGLERPPASIAQAALTDEQGEQR